MGQHHAGVRGLHHIVRNALIVSGVILLSLGGVLTLFPNDTDRLFSWTIDVALTAATLGGYYLAALVLVLATLSGGMTWARARVMLAGAVTFSALALVATLLHLDKFHFDASGLALVATWVWTVAYAILPPLIVIGLVPQGRVPGQDPPSELAPPWVPRAFGAIGVALLLVGVLLFLAPATMAKGWPWQLTPLTGRVLGAWTVGLGLVCVFAGRERARFPLTPTAAALATFGALQLLTLARFGDQMQWGEAGAWAYVAFVTGAMATGAVAWMVMRPVGAATPAVRSAAPP